MPTRLASSRLVGRLKQVQVLVAGFGRPRGIGVDFKVSVPSRDRLCVSPESLQREGSIPQRRRSLFDGQGPIGGSQRIISILDGQVCRGQVVQYGRIVRLFLRCFYEDWYGVLSILGFEMQIRDTRGLKL